MSMTYVSFICIFMYVIRNIHICLHTCHFYAPLCKICTIFEICLHSSADCHLLKDKNL